MKIVKVLYTVCFILSVTAVIVQLSSYIGLKKINMFKAASGIASETVFDNTKKVALTFDDGPHCVYTPMLLDELKKRNIRATFFVTGENAEINNEIIKRMNEEGHLIGNHTYSHIQLTGSNRETFEQELVKTNKIISDITKKEVEYVRPPYGTWDKKLENKLNMFPVMWSIDPLDWCSQNTTCVVQAVINKVKGNDIILLHDCYKTTVEAAGIIADELTKQGYTFVTVDEILFD